MRGRVGELAIELGWLDVDAVEKLAAFEVQRQGNDRDASGFDELRWKVGRRVGHDCDLVFGHSAGLSAFGSSRRRFLRSGKTRSSIDLRATRTMTTTSVVQIATPYYANPTAIPIDPAGDATPTQKPYAGHDLCPDSSGVYRRTELRYQPQAGEHERTRADQRD